MPWREALNQKMQIVKGDLIDLAKAGEFDIITHSCNCFCRMKRGIAPLMAAAFGCDSYPMESAEYIGYRSKLGQIDYRYLDQYKLRVVNSYMQYHWRTPSRYGFPFDYDACRSCLQVIVRRFSHLGRLRFGVPWIGCGLAGGDKAIVRDILEKEVDPFFDVSVVELY